MVRRDLNSSESSPSQGWLVSRGRVSCQADKRRVQRLEKQFAREMANLLCFDETILNALTPYRQYTYDEEDVVLAEVTEVSVSSDLQVAKVYVYFSGDDPEARMQAFNNLNRKAGYIRKELAQKVRTNERGLPCLCFGFLRTHRNGRLTRRLFALSLFLCHRRRSFFFFVFFADGTQVKMRRAPEVRLIYDKTVEEQEKLDEIFSDMRREREERRRQREGGEGEPAAAAMAMDPNDKEFLDNQDFYLDDSAFTE